MSYQVKTKSELEQWVAQNWNEANQFIDQLQKDIPTPIYNSVDIRESTDKFAPVDNNIYPAGFNNLCLFDLNMSSDSFKKALGPCDGIVGIIPESHTKNLFYLDHLHTLQSVLNQAGYKTMIMTPDHSLFGEGEESIDLVSKSEFPLTIHKAHYQDGNLKTASEEPSIIVLNNDQSSPLDIPWSDFKTQVFPTPKIGWFRRQKSQHFCYYKKIANQFCENFSIDPNLIQARSIAVEDVDFSSKEGLEQVASAVDELQAQLGGENPIFIKASQGTYGMGISVVTSGEEVLSMNRKTRNKMDVGKNKLKFTSVVVQEGVETVIKHDGDPAEVTIYLIAGQSVGGFMRVNPLKGTNANLNSRGMVYQKFCISEIRENSEHKSKEAVYSVIARLSSTASAYEIQEIEEKG